MRIIKIEVEFKRRGQRKIQKYAVSLEYSKYRKIKDYIQHVKKVCRISEEKCQLMYEGFVLPQNQSSRIVSDRHVYRLKCFRDDQKKSRISSVEISEEEAQSSSSFEIVNQIKSQDKSKRSKINTKKKSKNEKASKTISKVSEQSNSSVSVESSSPEESSSGSYEQEKISQSPPIRVRRTQTMIKRSDEKKMILQKQKTKKIEKIKVKPVQEKKIIKQIKQISSQESSLSEESSEDLPHIKPVKKTQNQIKQTLKSSNSINKRKIISDLESSESSQSKKKQMKKKTQKIQTRPIISKVPPALRYRYTKSALEKHKQTQWVLVSKQLLKQWQKKGNKVFCQVNNKIRFKIAQLDEEKFVPIKSGWIEGQISEIKNDNHVCLKNTSRQGKGFVGNFEMPEHNMCELELYKLLATKQQLQMIQKSKNQASQTPEIKEPSVIVELQKESKSQKDDKNSVQKYVCGQINYYFSDKNYNTDLYMQMHAARHPQKYIPFSFLLNFPKIKKVLTHQSKIYDYLKGDEAYARRSYEIDLDNKMIRKKNIIKKRKEQAESKKDRKQEGSAEEGENKDETIQIAENQ